MPGFVTHRKNKRVYYRGRVPSKHLIHSHVKYENDIAVEYPACTTTNYYYIDYEIRCNKCKKSFCRKCHGIPVRRFRHAPIRDYDFVCPQCCSSNEIAQLAVAVNEFLPHEIKDNRKEISDTISLFASSGLIVACANFLTCNNEISYKNKFEFDRHVDLKGRYTYRYHVDHIRKLRNDMTYSFIDDKHYRIFCHKCSRNNNGILFECCHSTCYRKDIMIENRTICSNHVYCESCGRLSIAKWGLNNCHYCAKYLCTMCCIDNKSAITICPSCYAKNKRNEFALFLDDVIDGLLLNLTEMIADYSIGGAVKCSNQNSCFNEVVVGNRSNLENNKDVFGNRIYWYLAKKQARNKGNFTLIHDDPFIIFCGDCSRWKLRKCKFKGRSKCGCNNQEASRQICQIHPRCDICEGIMSHRYQYQQCVIKDCHNYICFDCKHRMSVVLCNKCQIIYQGNISSDLMAKHIQIYHHNRENVDINNGKSKPVAMKCSYQNCGNSIVIEAAHQFNKLYVYQHRFKDNKLWEGDEEIERMFCEHCTKYRLQKCQIKGCLVSDVETICKNHGRCIQCDDITSNTCESCKYALCKHCGQPGYDLAIGYKCDDCKISEEKQSMIDGFKDVLYDTYQIIDNKIYNILANYAIGYIVQCCNERDNCDNEIVINDQMDKIRNDCIHSYELPAGYRFDKTITAPVRRARMYGEEWRIFCKQCSKKVEKCQFKGKGTYGRYYDCDAIDVNYSINDKKKKICYNHPECGKCKLIRNYHFTGDTCKYCGVWICDGCDIDISHFCKGKRIYLDKVAMKYQDDDNFEFNQDLIGPENYEMRKALNLKSFEYKDWKYGISNGDHGHKAKNRKKKLAYFERKNDRKMNKKMKREFYKKYALSLQY